MIWWVLAKILTRGSGKFVKVTVEIHLQKSERTSPTPPVAKVFGFSLRSATVHQLLRGVCWIFCNIAAFCSRAVLQGTVQKWRVKFLGWSQSMRFDKPVPKPSGQLIHINWWIFWPYMMVTYIIWRYNYHWSLMKFQTLAASSSSRVGASPPTCGAMGIDWRWHHKVPAVPTTEKVVVMDKFSLSSWNQP